MTIRLWSAPKPKSLTDSAGFPVSKMPPWSARLRLPGALAVSIKPVSSFKIAAFPIQKFLRWIAISRAPAIFTPWESRCYAAACLPRPTPQETIEWQSSAKWQLAKSFRARIRWANEFNSAADTMTSPGPPSSASSVTFINTVSTLRRRAGVSALFAIPVQLRDSSGSPQRRGSGGAHAGDRGADSGGRQEHAGVQSFVDDADYLGFAGAAALHDVAARRVWRACATSRGGGDLRRDVLHRCAAHQRNRHSHGLGCADPRYVTAGHARRNVPGEFGPARGHGCFLSAHANLGKPAFRRERARSVDVCERSTGLGCGSDCGVLRPRTAGNEHRSGRGVAPRMNGQSSQGAAFDAIFWSDTQMRAWFVRRRQPLGLFAKL